ncbi:MAG: hypothetical protein E6G08_08305 [Actinobacteria bacterium]|nr:MAG: hypothetical protein E6G08_08305 [Actinomycetota bacterium]
MSAITEPWKAPIAAPATIARMIASRPGSSWPLDGEIDLADQEHEHDAVGEQRRPGHLGDDVVEVDGAEEVARGQPEDEHHDPEREDDGRAA